jgi:hypothetical protein
MRARPSFDARHVLGFGTEYRRATPGARRAKVLGRSLTMKVLH